MFCQKLSSRANDINGLGHSDTGKALLDTLFDGLNMYFNYSGKASCFDYADIDDTNGNGFSAMDAQSFDFQSCTELIDPSCDDGVQDFFEPQPWDVTGYINDCEQSFGITPDMHRMDMFYGAKNILAASNIVFR